MLVEEVKSVAENKTKQLDDYGMLGVLFSSVKILKGMQVVLL